ncbi:MAG: ATP-dependent helicase [Flavisolibacter sp.]|nr:ATP-dependent helicase [Flavisolibacter sp.]
MATVYGYTGQAGTGKTTQIISKLNECLGQSGLPKHSCVLALTFMHGSRRRLTERLSVVKKERNVKVSCSTIDAFCTRIVQRFRRYIGFNKPLEVSMVKDEENDIVENKRSIQVSIRFIRKSFIELMSFSSVKNFISNSYPIIIVDEFQDCEGQLLDVIRSLSNCSCSFIIAGDEFQQLNANTSCEAIEWLTSICDLNELKNIHRTKNNSILNTASGLRSGSRISNSVIIKPVPSATLAAWSICLKIQKQNWGRNKSIALLYPASPMSSQFVKATLERLELPFPNGKVPLNAFPFIYEKGDERNPDFILARIENFEKCTIDLQFVTELEKNNNDILTRCAKKAKKLLFLRGEQEIEKSEFESLVRKECHLVSVYGVANEKNKRMAMTIHAAKNREYDEVIVLWPYEITPNQLQRRKLLYNAITRAKQNVFIIVQVSARKPIGSCAVLSLFDNVEEFNPSAKKNAASKK